MLAVTSKRILSESSYDCMLNREMNRAKYVIDPFGSCWGDSEYDLYQLENANGLAFGLLKRYAEKADLSQNFEIKKRFYRLYSEIGHYYDAHITMDPETSDTMAKELLEYLY